MDRIAVLASGGLDSCVLVADLARTAEVIPVHVSMGLVWEPDEIVAAVAREAARSADWHRRANNRRFYYRFGRWPWQRRRGARPPLPRSSGRAG